MSRLSPTTWASGLHHHQQPPLSSDRSLQQLAFPGMLHDLQPEADTMPQVMQLQYRQYLASQSLAWLAADLSFLNTHRIRFAGDSATVKSVNAFTVGLHSQFFNSLFKYNQQNDLEVQLGWLDCIRDSVSTALDSIGQLECRGAAATTATTTKPTAICLTDDNCLAMFVAADFILCWQLRDHCLEFIRRRCSQDATVALAVWRFARPLHLPDLTQASLRFVLRGFLQLRSTADFLEMEAASVREILSHRMLNCASELQVLQTISQWVQHRQSPQPESSSSQQQQQQQQQHQAVMEQLLCCIRLGQLDSAQMAALLADPLVAGNRDYQQFANAHPLPTAFGSRHAAALERSRHPRWPQQVLLALGGWYRRQGPTALCQVYDPRADSWDLRSSPATASAAASARPGSRQQQQQQQQQQQNRAGWLDDRSHACCALMGGVIYMVGGYSGVVALKSVLCFDRARPQLGWYEGSCMLQPRYYHCCASLAGFLYTMGGQTAERRLTHVERMRAADNSWVAIEPLVKPRCEAAAVAHRDQVLVAGGFDGRVHLDTAELYCPIEGAWTLVTGYMTRPRTGLGLAVLSGTVYALCGRNSGGWRRCVERSEDARTWKLHCEMDTARSNFGYGILDDRIYLLGGICGPSEKEIVATVEWVEPAQKTVGSAHPMPFPASGLTTCVLDLMEYESYVRNQQLRRHNERQHEQHEQSVEPFYPAPYRLLDSDAEAESTDDAETAHLA